MIRAAIVGGSGFVGGELARLLLDHPEVELAQVTSERLAGQPLVRLRGSPGAPAIERAYRVNAAVVALADQRVH